MERDILTRQEVQIARERRIKYQGAAKISIPQIQTRPPLPQCLNQEALERLRGIFRKDGFRRLEVDNFVPVIVSRHALDRAISKANISAQDLLNSGDKIPLLDFESKEVLALHGRHRLQVGSELLAFVERWWTVDIYLDDMGMDLRTSLIEEYANENAPTDGQIYWKIRQSEAEEDESSRQRWFVRLSKNKQMRLDQLDNSRNRRLRQGFNRLLHIRGLWLNGLRISMLHRIIAAAAVEEVLNYLTYIYNTYLYFVDGDENALRRIGSDTVNSIHLMAPGSSEKDAILMRGMVLSGKAFGEFTEEERSDIWSRMSLFRGIIPSLYTFFEDFKYLEACSHCLRKIIGTPLMSIRNTLKHSFTPMPAIEKSFPIQKSEKSFVQLSLTRDQCFDMAYRQLWLFAMRHYLSMPRATGDNDKLLAKPGSIKADSKTLNDLAGLASRLGFRSIEIEEALAKSPDRQIALSALLEARKPNEFKYPDSQLESLVSRVVECFSCAIERSDEPSIILADSLVEARVRCGMPQLRTHSQDKAHLFVPEVHCEQNLSPHITTLFVRQCVYFAFLGKPDDTKSSINNTSNPSERREFAENTHSTPTSGSHDTADTEMPDITSAVPLRNSSDYLVDTSLSGSTDKSSLANGHDHSTAAETAQVTEESHDENMPNIPTDKTVEDATGAEVPTRLYSPSIYSSRLSETSEPSTIVRVNVPSTVQPGTDNANDIPETNTSELMEVQSRPSWTVEDNPDEIQKDPAQAIARYSTYSNEFFQTTSRRRVRSDQEKALNAEEGRPHGEMPMTIEFLRLQDGEIISYEKMHDISTSAPDTRKVEEKAQEYLTTGHFIFDTQLRSINPKQCFTAAKVTLEHQILLIHQADDLELEKLGLKKYDLVAQALSRTRNTLPRKRKRDPPPPLPGPVDLGSA